MAWSGTTAHAVAEGEYEGALVCSNAGVRCDGLVGAECFRCRVEKRGGEGRCNGGGEVVSERVMSCFVPVPIFIVYDSLCTLDVMPQQPVLYSFIPDAVRQAACPFTFVIVVRCWCWPEVDDVAGCLPSFTCGTTARPICFCPMGPSEPDACEHVSQRL